MDSYNSSEFTSLVEISRLANTLQTVMDMGMDDIYEVRICRVQPEAHPERQIDVSVFIKKQQENRQ